MHVEASAPVGVPPGSKRRFPDCECLAFATANPELNVERTAEGEIEIVAPASLEPSYREVNVGRHLSEWAERDGRGQGFGATVRFMLTHSSARSPDAAWVSKEALAQLSGRGKRSFPHPVPEFVVEARSPSNSLKKAKTTMERWTANRIQLGWSGGHETVYIDAEANRPNSGAGFRKWRAKGQGRGLR